jgi:tripartite-type tricarboxylate transporter receptor subunit TctC
MRRDPLPDILILLNQGVAMKPMNRSLVILLGGVLFAGCSASNTTSPTSAYPRKTVTIICPWAAGGGTDRIARFWAEALQAEFGKPFVVVNRTGGSGAIGHATGASAAPDGYTITLATCELATMHRMGITELTFANVDCLLQMNADPAAIFVRGDAPWQDLREWIDHVKGHPGKIKMSGTATGGTWDLARAGLMVSAGLPADATLWVPKEGSAPALIELLGGHLDAVCCSVPEAAAQLDGGQVRALCVMSEERLPDYPDIPTATESGLQWVSTGWRGLTLPQGTPPDIIARLEEKCVAITKSEKFKDFMEKNRFGIRVRGAREFTEFAIQQDEQWKAVLEAAGYASH